MNNIKLSLDTSVDITSAEIVIYLNRDVHGCLIPCSLYDNLLKFEILVSWKCSCYLTSLEIHYNFVKF